MITRPVKPQYLLWIWTSIPKSYFLNIPSSSSGGSGGGGGSGSSSGSGSGSGSGSAVVVVVVVVAVALALALALAVALAVAVVVILVVVNFISDRAQQLHNMKIDIIKIQEKYCNYWWSPEKPETHRAGNR